MRTENKLQQLVDKKLIDSFYMVDKEDDTGHQNCSITIKFNDGTILELESFSVCNSTIF